MRAVVQRVVRGGVSVGGNTISSIGQGLVVLLGISADDTPHDANFIISKLLNLKIFDSEEGKPWAKSVVERNFEVLMVSQFTLWGQLKGNKLDFHKAMGTDAAKAFYTQILADMRGFYAEDKIKDGEFGAMMEVEIVNDGPVTIELDSRRFEYQESDAEVEKKAKAAIKAMQSK